MILPCGSDLLQEEPLVFLIVDRRVEVIRKTKGYIVGPQDGVRNGPMKDLCNGIHCSLKVEIFFF